MWPLRWSICLEARPDHFRIRVKGAQGDVHQLLPFLVGGEPKLLGGRERRN